LKFRAVKFVLAEKVDNKESFRGNSGFIAVIPRK
jgi:hypothetical protein